MASRPLYRTAPQPTISTAPFAGIPEETLAVLFFRGERPLFGEVKWPAELQKRVKRTLQRFSGKKSKGYGELLQIGESGDLLLFVDPEQKGLDPQGDALRLLGQRAYQAAQIREVKSVSFLLPGATAEQAALLAEGVRHASYAFTAYKSAPQNDSSSSVLPALKLLLPAAEIAPTKKLLLRQTALFPHIALARDLVNTPGSDLTPELYATRIQKLFEKSTVQIKVRNAAALRKEGFNGLITVGKGSPNAPHMVTMSYKPAKSRKGIKLALVGKGVTFDTGGIDLKPSERMWEMKTDMSGSAAVVGAMATIAALKLPIEVVGIVSLAENRPSGIATLPGDIFVAKNGKTVMVDNTDAEGRLVLSDALCEASDLGCTHIVDLATLTGAVVRALGSSITGYFSNDDSFAEFIARVGSEQGEKFWRLPLETEYREHLDDPVADMKNCCGVAGTITAALFLQEFVGEGITWSHWDIAGTAFSDKAWKYYGKGGTGWGIKSMVALAEQLGK